MILIALVSGLLGLASYARHDRFAGPRNIRFDVDDVGSVPERHLARR
jgi:hypothetical protein